ncbi:hypothetical protein OO013_07190 [Mangrovivirga sp. M17]|uniref:Lipoprotein n=1 Tax=Mangrovivirga halotolerans TaxID=2993936 RepID=A0ABT3RPD0_9BACT|nr:hypothetical protein [Mangrovivirga halotolerans]MCX2743642.1 hypothetical protein [Mangrovivirga halotolerans]
MIYRLFLIFCYAIILIGCNNKNGNQESNNNFRIEDRNKGLIGGGFNTYYVSPVDSNVWLLNNPLAEDAFTTNAGITWKYLKWPTQTSGTSILSRKGFILRISNDKIYKLDVYENKTSEIAIPDSVNSTSFFLLGHDGYVLIYNTDNNKYLFPGADLTAKPVPISQQHEDSLKSTLINSQKEIYSDSSFLTMNSGHLFYKNPETGKWEKRMNGLNKPQITHLLQQDFNSKTVYAIEWDNPRWYHKHYYYVYETNNFGKSWALIDSTDNLDNLISNKKLKKAHDFTESRIIIPKQSFSSSLQVNDTLRFYKKNDNIHIESDKSIYTSINSPINNNILSITPKTLGIYDYPSYAFIVENDSIQVLFANKNGGIGYFKGPLSGKPKSSK